MLMLVDIEPGPAKKMIGYRCDSCGREVLFDNPANTDELKEMSEEKLDHDAIGLGRQHICRNCRLSLKITGSP